MFRGGNCLGGLGSDIFSGKVSIYVNLSYKDLKKNMDSSTMDKKLLVSGRSINFLDFLSFLCRVTANNSFWRVKALKCCLKGCFPVS